MNNIRKIKQDLRAYAKRCKDVHYTDSLLITFLITGMFFAAGNLFSASIDASIENQRQAISNSIKTINQQVKSTRRENDKLLKNTNLELIKLMEQGDHVIKSPWSSWQYGMNYFNNNWNGTYKGRGDKKAKYPYQGILERDTNEFNRYMPTNSENYGLLGKSRGVRSAATNARQGLPIGYGIASNIPVPEPPVSTIVNAGINPRNINKSPLNLTPKVANSPTLPEPVRFSPIDPDIVPPADPSLPVPPTFKVYLGADCNSDGGLGCSSTRKPGQHADAHDATYNYDIPRQETSGTFLTSGLNGRSKQDIPTILHYTWPGVYGVPKSAGALAFKMWKDEDRIPRATNGDITLPKENVHFNSYNYSYDSGINEYPNAVQNAQDGHGVGGKNNQYFFVGGSRFIEIDNRTGGIYNIPSGKTVNLGGIFTLGLVSQENGTDMRNSGTITDEDEKDEYWIQHMPTDAGKNYLTIHGPTEDYQITKSGKGYVG